MNVYSRCRRFDLLFFAVLAQSVAAMTKVIAFRLSLFGVSTNRDAVTAPFRGPIEIKTRAGDTVSARFGCFSPIKNC